MQGLCNFREITDIQIRSNRFNLLAHETGASADVATSIGLPPIKQATGWPDGKPTKMQTQAPNSTNQKQRNSENEIEIAKVEKIKYLHSMRRAAGTGIGFLDVGTPQEKLIEYEYTPDDGFSYQEISLEKSIEWARNILFAETRYSTGNIADICQDGDAGTLRWLDLIRAALA